MEDDPLIENTHHNDTPWHSLPIDKVYKNLNSSPEGLSDNEAAKRLKENGPNELRQKEKRTLWQMLFDQLKDPMIIILFAASALSFFLHETLEGSVILLIIVINAIISIAQEKKAASSIESLKSMTASKAIALRQGEESIIAAKDLVVGDVVMLEDGSMIPADVRLIDSFSMKIQESSLTGESVPVEKDSDDILQENCPLGDRTTMAYSSTFVTYGRGYGIVVDTGMNTQVGQIAKLMDEQDELDTPIKQKLASVGKSLTIVGIIVSALIFIIGLLYKQPFTPLLMTAISLAISVIPEGLPATATIVLALGVQRMAKRGAIVRKLPAVETLGGATVICSDKTGTLTLNKMSVTKVAISEDFQLEKSNTLQQARAKKHNYMDLIIAGALCNNAEFDPDSKGNILGDPTEGALIVLSRDFQMSHDILEENFPRLFEQPFDSDRKRMSTINQVEENKIVYTKGAVDEVLSVCTKISTPQGDREITQQDIEQIRKVSSSMAEDALRVLSFAKKIVTDVPEDDAADIEFDLSFIGLVGMIDPPREEVKPAIQTCYDAGIRTVMITGDHKITALAIAKELNIWREHDTIYTGSELEEMSEIELDEAVKTTSVYARVSPEQKLEIVEALQRNGEVVAMLGDGVNDAPALKAADIGAAMGITGTDVAKESADMILTDDNFTTVVAAVKEGRRVYRNIQKVIQFLLAGNISEILTILVATIFNLPAPLLAVHILWINLATDTLPALALGIDPPESDIMKRKPLKSNSLFEKNLVIKVILQGALIAAATFASFMIGYRTDLQSAQAMAFCTIAFAQLFYSYSQRTDTKTIFSKGFFENKYLLFSILVSAGLMLLLIFVPFLRETFMLSAISSNEWLVVLITALLPSVCLELFKVIKKHIS